jgi:hypothetical protein
MPRGYGRVWLTICALMFAGATFAAESWIIEGRVVATADGDTITILDRDKHQHKIRVNRIDAPEKKQPFGQRSRRNLSSRSSIATCALSATSATATAGRYARYSDGPIDVGLESRYVLGTLGGITPTRRSSLPRIRNFTSARRTRPGQRRSAYGATRTPCRRGSGVEKSAGRGRGDGGEARRIPAPGMTHALRKSSVG